MKTGLLTLGFLLIAIIDLSQVIKKKDKKAILIVCFLILSGYFISLMQIWKIDLPNPTKIITSLVESFVQIKFSFQ